MLVAGGFLSAYSQLMLYAVYFLLTRVNTASNSWWEKTPSEWIILLVITLVTAYSTYCTIKVFNKTVEKSDANIGLSLVLFIHIFVTAIWAQGEAGYFFIAMIIPLVAGIGTLHTVGRNNRMTYKQQP